MYKTLEEAIESGSQQLEQQRIKTDTEEKAAEAKRRARELQIQEALTQALRQIFPQNAGSNDMDNAIAQAVVDRCGGNVDYHPVCTIRHPDLAPIQVNMRHWPEADGRNNDGRTFVERIYVAGLRHSIDDNYTGAEDWPMYNIELGFGNGSGQAAFNHWPHETKIEDYDPAAMLAFAFRTKQEHDRIKSEYEAREAAVLAEYEKRQLDALETIVEEVREEGPKSPSDPMERIAIACELIAEYLGMEPAN
ncbi:MAG: hypothetical protein GY803_08100 [Chloroflexi bacterium]|nr:hypothetical protein [Chloroflexota bacterium]